MSCNNQNCEHSHVLFLKFVGLVQQHQLRKYRNIFGNVTLTCCFCYFIMLCLKGTIMLSVFYLVLRVSSNQKINIYRNEINLIFKALNTYDHKRVNSN